LIHPFYYKHIFICFCWWVSSHTYYVLFWHFICASTYIKTGLRLTVWMFSLATCHQEPLTNCYCLLAATRTAAFTPKKWVRSLCTHYLNNTMDYILCSLIHPFYYKHIFICFCWWVSSHTYYVLFWHFICASTYINCKRNWQQRNCLKLYDITEILLKVVLKHHSPNP
jgi:hypothetical protein